MLGERARLGVVEASRLVDLAVLGSKTDFFAAIKRFKPDVIAFGYDQKPWPKLGARIAELGVRTRFVRLKAFKPRWFKSSRLRKLFEGVGA